MFKNLNYLETKSLIKKGKNLVLERFNDIFLIGLNRPEKRNALTHDMVDNLVESLKIFYQNDTKVAVLYGLGGNFCAGYDIKEFNFDEKSTRIKDMLDLKISEKNQSKPIIAALTGYAVAAGFELALLSDLRVADKSTSMVGLFNRRFGIPCLDGIAPKILPNLIGYGRALDLILTGRAISGKEACDWGLVNIATEDGTAIGKAINLAASIAKFPQEALLWDKQVTFQNVFGSPDATSTSKPPLHKHNLEKARKFIAAGKGTSFNIDDL